MCFAFEGDVSAAATSVYKVSIRISDLESAGTDENIYIEIMGDIGATRRITLEQSETNETKFVRGQTDVFTIESIDVGKVRGNLVLY